MSLCQEYLYGLHFEMKGTWFVAQEMIMPP